MTDATAADPAATSPRPRWFIRYSALIALVALLVAVAGAATELYGIIGYRMGKVQMGQIIAASGGLLRNGAYIAAAGASLCLIVTIAFAALAKKGTGRSAMISAVGIIIGGLAFYFPASFRMGPPSPAIHEVTTDTENPPMFVDAIPLRKATGARNPPEYIRERGRAPNVINVPEAQKKAFPDIQPVVLKDVPPAEAFKRAAAAVEKMNWHLISAKQEEGRIEAWDQTFWMRFIDDVVIRITPAENGSIVDVRSKSRIGGGDAGTNAKRVRNYIAKLDKSTPAK